MSTKYANNLAPPPSLEPLQISKRKLPPLPISKRQLPGLPQSRSGYAHNACSYDTTAPVKKTSIIITPPKEPQHNHQTSLAIRNFFNKVQTKLTKTNHNKIPEIPETVPVPIMKSKWRPNQTFLCDDDELLSALTTFMTKQYNEENILFVQSVHTLNQTINNLLMFESQINIVKTEKIDVEIASIYNKYITHTAQKQINLSFGCFTNIMHIRQTFKQLSLTEKTQMFNVCVTEIQCLIQTSILAGFYSSEEFQSIARLRNIFDNNTNVQQERDELNVSEDIDYDSDDIEYENENKCDHIDVHFDVCSLNKWKQEHNKYILSSRGFAANSGTHEWKIKILKCSQHRQEFGVISNFDENICMNEYGVCDTQLFGARCVYGYNKLMKLNKNGKCKRIEHNFYYASYNKDNSARCNKDLSALNIHQRPWAEGDVITICLNLTKASIKFFLNAKQVRKTISIERNTTYYPIILFSGDCRFKVIS